MEIRVKALSLYELGQRANQEDSIWPDATNMASVSDLYVLCDGMGGHESGEIASQTVCQVMSEYVDSHRRADGYFGQEDFQAALDAAYDALDKKDSGAEKKMGTTLVFVKFHRGGCFIAHIGDSRVYQIRPSRKQILFVTRDHSLMNDLIALGELSLEEAKTFRQKNVITRAMQPNQERRTKADCVNLTEISPGDYFYMCSDGMLEIQENNEIVNIISMRCSDARKIEILRGATQNNKDNHSAQLIRVVRVEEETESGNVESEPVDSGEDKSVLYGVFRRNGGKRRKVIIASLIVLLLLIIGGTYCYYRCGKKEIQTEQQ